MFSGESRLEELVLVDRILTSKIVFRGSNAFGVIGITSPDLATISNPGNVHFEQSVARPIQVTGNRPVYLCTEVDFGPDP